MSHIQVVVIDDEPLVRERVCDLVRESPRLELVGVASNGLEALSVIDATKPDLILIDIEMPELDGFGVVAALEPENVPVVVFVTAFERYALQAFEVGAIDYLHKPITKQRFEATVERAASRIADRARADREMLIATAISAGRERGFRERFVVRRANAYYFVPVGEIDWIDVADNYLQLHAAGRVHLARGTMKQAEDELDPLRFVRVHRSLMVAIDRIVSMRAHEGGGHVIEVRGGTSLRASRQYGERLRQLIGAV